MTNRALRFDDYFSLRALSARFDTMAEGRAPGNSAAAHRSVLDRLTANRHLAEALGWTGCVVERQGGTGRLVLRGMPSAGGHREVAPDWVPALRPSPQRARGWRGASSRPANAAARCLRPAPFTARVVQPSGRPSQSVARHRIPSGR